MAVVRRISGGIGFSPGGGVPGPEKVSVWGSERAQPRSQGYKRGHGGKRKQKPGGDQSVPGL